MKSIVNIAVIIFMFNEAINAQYNCVMVNPLPEKRNLNFIVSNGSRYVAGGEEVLLTSHNGWSWTAIDSVTKSSLNLKAAVWTGTQFVVIDEYGRVMTSIDGLNWKTFSVENISSANFMAWTGSKLVVVENAYNNGLTTSISSDGVSWTNYEVEDFRNNELVSVTWTGNRLYAAGDGGIITSVDGINWDSVQTNIDGEFSSITWTGNKLIATCNKNGIGIVLTSLDGEEWTVDTISKDNTLNCAVSDGSQIIVGATKSIFTSSDGNTWNEWKLVNSRESVNYVNRIGNRYFAVGNNGTMYTSEDGITWSNRPAATLFSVIWTGELFVAVGVSTILTSPDGYIWTERFDSIYQFQSVAGQGSRLVAVGYQGKIYFSSDGGISWAKQFETQLTWLNSVTWTGSMFVAVGSDGTVITSPDGVDWTIRPTGISTTLKSITWTGSKLVVTGFNEDVILTSEDGISWTKNDRFRTKLSYVTWTGSKLLGLGVNSLYFSEDGENWTKQDVNWTIETVNSMLWTGKEYITAGVIGGKPAICVSYNAYVWRNMVWVPLNSYGTLYSIATNGKTIVAVGDTGLIFACEPDNGNAVSPPQFYRQTHEKISIHKKWKNHIIVRIPDSFAGKKLSFQIYSIAGKRLRSIKGADGPLVHIPALGFSPGKYFLTAEWHGGRQAYPFTIDQ